MITNFSKSSFPYFQLEKLYDTVCELQSQKKKDEKANKILFF